MTKETNAKTQIDVPEDISEIKDLRKHYKNKLPYVRRSEDPKGNALYHAEELRQLEKFKRDTLFTVDLLDHLKADLIFSKAWDDSHSYSYGEVLDTLGELADFVRELEEKA